MLFVVEFYFDATTEARIRDAWKAIDEIENEESNVYGKYLERR